MTNLPTPELQAAVELLTRHIGNIDNNGGCVTSDEGTKIAAAAYLILAALEERGKALEPFAEAAKDFRPDDADTMRPAVVQAIHFRRALTALGGTADV